MSSSRFVHGSRPSTFNSPSYDVSPRIALSAVVLPAPFGPIIPRMRPSSICKSYAFQRYRRSERLAKTACFYRRHDINAFSLKSGALLHPALFV